MEKLVLVPYDKYQRMLKHKQNPTVVETVPYAEYTTPERKSKPSPVPLRTASKKNKNNDTFDGTNKKKRKENGIDPPPPGKRDVKTKIKTDAFADWISF